MKQDPCFPNLSILNHPLIQHRLTHMRDKDTSTRTFCELLREITLLMGYETTRNLPLTSRCIDTPMGPMEAPVIAGRKLAMVSVLRVGVGTSDRLAELIPLACIGHTSMYRDDQHRLVEYLVQLPDLEDRTFILRDPMVAAGYLAVHTAGMMKKRGVLDENVLFLAFTAVPEGVEVFQKAHLGMKLFVVSLDSHLDENAYIIPSLGDADDRLFGTKSWSRILSANKNSR